MVEKIVTIQHLQKIYGKKNENEHMALKDVSFEVDKGDFVGIMGPSGSGKTTLLNILATLDTATKGSISITGQDLSMLDTNGLAEFRSQKLGFIFQHFNLLDNLSIYENIALPLSLQNESSVAIRTKVEQIAKTLGITRILNIYPNEVSGGQQQRAAAARALVHQPDLLLGDEPTGALDSKNAQSLLESMKALNEEALVTILLVTHDAFSASYCKRILFIKDGLLFKEILRTGTRQEFYKEILSVLEEYSMAE